MLQMLVLLQTPVATFCLSGAPVIRDDLHLATRIQSAGPSCSVPRRPSSRRAVVVMTFPAADRP